MSAPYGEDLCSGTVATGSLTKDPGIDDVEITFSSSTELTSGQAYSIICRCSTATVNNAVLWGGDTAAGYANGNRCGNSNAGEEYNWQSWTNRDTTFTTKANGVVKDSYTTFNHYQYIYGDWWIAQTFVAGSTYTITSVVLKLARSVNATNPGTLTVSIREAVSAPSAVINPTPIDDYTNMTLDWQQFLWESASAEPDREVYDIYFGTEADNLTLIALESPIVSVAQSYLQTVVGIGVYSTTYYWRVDAKNNAGTTTGTVWSLSTIVFAAPAPGGRGGTGGTPGGTAADKQVNIATRLVAFAKNKVFYEDV